MSSPVVRWARLQSTSVWGKQQEHLPYSGRWRVLSVLLIALFMSIVSVSIVNVALPSIRASLDATHSELQWVLSGYALTFGVGLVSAGRAGDIFGRGPLFIVGVALFTTSSIAAGLAPDPLSLNIARAFQGIGSGLLSPQVVGMIQHYFRGSERARAFGFLGAAVGVAVVVGPLLGGLLIGLAGVDEGWRWTFFVNVPVGAIGIVLAFLWIPRPLFTRNRNTAATLSPASRDLDPVGALLLGLAVLAVLLPFVEAGVNGLVWISLPIGVGILLVWLWWEQRYKRLGRSPMVDLAIFRTRSFANGSLLISLYFMGASGVWVLVALYMQDGLGHSALDTGLVVLPSSTLSVFAALWGGRNVVRYGRMVVIGGMYSGIFGLVLSMGVVWMHSLELASEWWLLLSLSFLGISQGLVVSPNQALTLVEVPLRYAGSSGGIMQTGQQIGVAVGFAIVTTIAFAVLGVSDWAVAFNVGFAAILVILTLSLIVATVDLRYRT